jgi:hypothetical protein
MQSHFKEEHLPVSKFVVGFCCLLVVLMYSGCWSAKEDAEKLEAVKSVWARMPSYPGMQETYSNTTSGYGKALVSKHYRSNAQYEDVKRFYVDHLQQDGWKLEGEQQLKGLGSDFGGYEIRFRKADLAIAIEYAGPRANYDWQYGIGVSWSRWVKEK